MDYAQLIAHKGRKDGEEWIKALTALASADPDNADEYIKPHPTLSILDETGRNPKMKLFKVTKTVDEEYTDEEQHETVRQFEGDMADVSQPANQDRVGQTNMWSQHTKTHIRATF